MSLGQLSSRGKQNNKVYYYTVYFRTYDNKKAGIFSFVSNYDISTKNELCQFIWDKGDGNIWKSIRVTGNYIDVDGDGEKIGFIRLVGTNYSPTYNININYSHYKQSTNTLSGDSYNFTNAEINIYRYVI